MLHPPPPQHPQLVASLSLFKWNKLTHHPNDIKPLMRTVLRDNFFMGQIEPKQDFWVSLNDYDMIFLLRSINITYFVLPISWPRATTGWRPNLLSSKCHYLDASEKVWREGADLPAPLMNSAKVAQSPQLWHFDGAGSTRQKEKVSLSSPPPASYNILEMFFYRVDRVHTPQRFIYIYFIY